MRISVKSKSIFKINFIIVIFFLFLLFFNFSININNQKFNKTVKLGIYENEPKVFIDKKGKPSGIFVDLVIEIAKNEGWKLEFIIDNWDNCLEMLKLGNIDLMPDVAFSEERNKFYDFNKISVLVSYSTFYSNKNIKINKLSDLDNKKIAVLKLSIQEKNLLLLKQSLQYNFELVEVSTIKDAFNLTKQGVCDFAISNSFFGDYFYKEYDLKKTNIELFPVELFFASKKNENIDMLNTIDNYLIEWKQKRGSFYYKTLKKWQVSERAKIDNLVKTIIFFMTFIAISFIFYSIILKTRTKILKNRISLAVESIKLSEKIFKDFSNISPIGIFKLDKEGKLEFVNKIWEETSGYGNDEFLSIRFFENIIVKDNDQIKNSWNLLIKENKEGGRIVI